MFDTNQKHRIIIAITTNTYWAYLHDDEEDECDEDVDLGVFPSMVVTDVVKLLGHALTAPRTVVEQCNQRLVLSQLKKQKRKGLSCLWLCELQYNTY